MCFRIPADVVLKVSYSFIRVKDSCSIYKDYIASDSKLFLSSIYRNKKKIKIKMPINQP